MAGNKSLWSKPLALVVGAFIIVVLLASFFNLAGLVSIDYELTSDDYLKTLTALFFIALLVERLIEVTLTVSRSKQKDIIKADIKTAADANDAARGETLNHELITYRNETEKRAMTVAMVIGLILGLAGVQILGTLFDASYLEGTQKYVFNGIDILLTAALIAGGSNGVKQVTSVFRDFLQSSRGG